MSDTNITATTSSSSHNSLPGTEFPRGLRVLAVDDGLVSLKILVRMLEVCDYKVKSTSNPKEALEKLRKEKAEFDIVITNVKNHGMDGFSFMASVSLETDLPVIMISSDDKPETVMKGIRDGARDYILKPVSLEVIKNIWLHVFRKSLNKPDDSSILKDETVSNSDESYKQKSIKMDSVMFNIEEPCPQKKSSRLVWTKELHNKFVDAVDAIKQQGKMAVPNEILKAMNEPAVNRKNISSHLQKFRSILNCKDTKNNQEGNISSPGSNKRHYSALTKFNPNQIMDQTPTMQYRINPDFARVQNDYRYTKTEPSSSQYQYQQQQPSVVNNQQHMMLQNHMMTQPRNNMHIPMHQNAASSSSIPNQLLIENHQRAQVFNRLRSCEAGPSSYNSFMNNTNTAYPSVFDHSHRMLGAGGSANPSFPVCPQNFITGQHERMNQMFGVNKGVELDMRHQMNNTSPLEMHSTLNYPSEKYPSIDSFQNAPQGTSNQEGGLPFHARSSSEDDLASMVQLLENNEDIPFNSS